MEVLYNISFICFLTEIIRFESVKQIVQLQCDYGLIMAVAIVVFYMLDVFFDIEFSIIK